MITEFILNIVFNLVMGFLQVLPAVDFVVPTEWVAFFTDSVRVVCFLLPIGTVKSILTLVVGFTVFRIVIALIKTIWDLLPIV